MQPYATKQFYLKQPHATIWTVINNYWTVLLLSCNSLIIFGILYVLEIVGHKSVGKEETHALSTSLNSLKFKSKFNIQNVVDWG